MRETPAPWHPVKTNPTEREGKAIYAPGFSTEEEYRMSELDRARRAAKVGAD